MRYFMLAALTLISIRATASENSPERAPAWLEGKWELSFLEGGQAMLPEDIRVLEFYSDYIRIRSPYGVTSGRLTRNYNDERVIEFPNGFKTPIVRTMPSTAYDPDIHVDLFAIVTDRGLEWYRRYPEGMSKTHEPGKDATAWLNGNWLSINTPGKQTNPLFEHAILNFSFGKARFKSKDTPEPRDTIPPTGYVHSHAPNVLVMDDADGQPSVEFTLEADSSMNLLTIRTLDNQIYKFWRYRDGIALGAQEDPLFCKDTPAWAEGTWYVQLTRKNASKPDPTMKYTISRGRVEIVSADGKQFPGYVRKYDSGELRVLFFPDDLNDLGSFHFALNEEGARSLREAHNYNEDSFQRETSELLNGPSIFQSRAIWAFMFVLLLMAMGLCYIGFTGSGGTTLQSNSETAEERQSSETAGAWAIYYYNAMYGNKAAEDEADYAEDEADYAEDEADYADDKDNRYTRRSRYKSPDDEPEPETAKERADREHRQRDEDERMRVRRESEDQTRKWREEEQAKDAERKYNEERDRYSGGA